MQSGSKGVIKQATKITGFKPKTNFNLPSLKKNFSILGSDKRYEEKLTEIVNSFYSSGTYVGQVKKGMLLYNIVPNNKDISAVIECFKHLIPSYNSIIGDKIIHTGVNKEDLSKIYYKDPKFPGCGIKIPSLLEDPSGKRVFVPTGFISNSKPLKSGYSLYSNYIRKEWEGNGIASLAGARAVDNLLSHKISTEIYRRPEDIHSWNTINKMLKLIPYKDVTHQYVKSYHRIAILPSDQGASVDLPELLKDLIERTKKEQNNRNGAKR